MRTKLSFASLGVGASMLFNTHPASAADATYKLEARSHFEDGCHAPCLCPIFFAGALRGTFGLTLVQRNPLFDRYAITEIHWDSPTVPFTFTGTGEYTIGGEVAISQHLTLNLHASNGTDYALTSDVTVPSVQFPRINAEADNQVDNGCRYALVLLDASPIRCIGDFNQDGGIDGSDVESFFRAWSAGEADADVNDDGGIDGSDVQTFFDHWAQGSC